MPRLGDQPGRNCEESASWFLHVPHSTITEGERAVLPPIYLVKLRFYASEAIVKIDDLAEQQIEAGVEFLIQVGEAVFYVRKPALHAAETVLYGPQTGGQAVVEVTETAVI